MSLKKKLLIVFCSPTELKNKIMMFQVMQSYFFLILFKVKKSGFPEFPIFLFLLSWYFHATYSRGCLFSHKWGSKKKIFFFKKIILILTIIFFGVSPGVLYFRLKMFFLFFSWKSIVWEFLLISGYSCHFQIYWNLRFFFRTKIHSINQDLNHRTQNFRFRKQ